MRKVKAVWSFWNRRCWLERSETCACDWNWRLGYGSAGGKAARTGVLRDRIRPPRLFPPVNGAGKLWGRVLQQGPSSPFVPAALSGGFREFFVAGESAVGRSV